MIDQGGKKCEKHLRFFVGMENFTFREVHVGEKYGWPSPPKIQGCQIDQQIQKEWHGQIMV